MFSRRNMVRGTAVAAVLASGMAVGSASAQTAFGVNAAGQLFQFELNAPASVTVIGSVGFVPEGIDFRPGTNLLHALDVGPNTTQVYTIDVGTGVATPVGAGFASSGVNYDLTVNQSFGFDFNPKTLQVDNSMRIRVTSTSGTNLRLNSATGLIAAVDTNLAFAGGNAGFVDGSAYINNIPQAAAAGTTTLYNLDSRNDALLTQIPPNTGVLNLVGPLGLTVDAQSGIGFDVYTNPTDVDPTIAGDSAYAVLKRSATSNGDYLLYSVDLATGTISNGALVGPANAPFDFVGGFAVSPVVIPEPMAVAPLALGALALVRRTRRA